MINLVKLTLHELLALYERIITAEHEYEEAGVTWDMQYDNLQEKERMVKEEFNRRDQKVE